MKSSKKLLVALLVFTMLLSTVSVGFAADVEADAAPAVVRAQALGILKGDQAGNLNLDKPITRAEALALVVRILGLESSADLMTGMTQFPDVTNAHWASGYVNLGVGQKIVNGYPDGSFKPEGNVTYAEMAKMLLHAMNYGGTLKGSVWPAGVMGKADDLDLFDDVNAAPDVPAIRGDVVQMIDNSLTVKHLVQKGYGDLEFYEEGEDTFLSKLKVEELKDVVVTEIAKVNNKLDDDEIRLEGKGIDDVFTLIADASAEEIFGLKVDAWANKDDEVFFVKVKTADKDILLDSAEAKSNDKEIELKVADKKYKWAKDATVYVNYKEEDVDEVPAGAYGKVILDRGEIAFANFFNFDNKGVVEEVEKDVVKYARISNAKSARLNLKDAIKDGDVYVYDANFRALDFDAVEEGVAIFFWSDDDVYHIIVKEDAVIGELNRVKSDAVRIDGKDYDVAADAIFTDDEGDSYEKLTLSKIAGLTTEDVKVLFDLNGEVFFLTSDAEAKSGTIYGIVLDVTSGRNPEVVVYTKDGEVTYKIAREDAANIGDIDYTVSSIKYPVVSFKVDSDNEIKDIHEVHVDDITVQDSLTKDPEKAYVDGATSRYYVTKDTVILRALNTDGKLAPSVIDYKKFVDSKIESSNNEAVVFGDAGKNAKLIVFLNEDFGMKEDEFEGVVTAAPYKDGKDWYVKIKVLEEGEIEYKVSSSANLGKGDYVKFSLDSDDKISFATTDHKKFDNTGIAFSTYTYDDGFVDVGSSVYKKVSEDAIIYEVEVRANGTYKLGDALESDDLEDYKKGHFIMDEDDVYIVVAYVTDYVPGGAAPTPTPDRVLDAVNSASNAISMRNALARIGFSEFEELDQTEQRQVAGAVLSQRTSEGNFEDLDQVKAAIDDAINLLYDI